MANSKVLTRLKDIDYPYSDGQPMGETPEHRDNLAHLIEMLRTWFAQDDQTYVSGNSFLYYVPGNRLRHVSPDVFVVRGIPKTPERRRYLVWEEGKAPDLIIELTSPSTYEEDLEDKFTIYRDILHVQEYFLFDPLHECLEPRLQGFRLRKDGSYAPIRRVKGRLPSKVLGLSLEANGWELRLHDPATDQWLPTPEEVQQALNAERQARLAEQQARLAEQQARLAEQQARLEAEAENERLRKEIDQLRRRNKG